MFRDRLSTHWNDIDGICKELEEKDKEKRRSLSDRNEYNRLR